MGHIKVHPRSLKNNSGNKSSQSVVQQTMDFEGEEKTNVSLPFQTHQKFTHDTELTLAEIKKFNKNMGRWQKEQSEWVGKYLNSNAETLTTPTFERLKTQKEIMDSIARFKKVSDKQVKYFLKIHENSSRYFKRYKETLKK